MKVVLVLCAVFAAATAVAPELCRQDYKSQLDNIKPGESQCKALSDLLECADTIKDAQEQQTIVKFAVSQQFVNGCVVEDRNSEKLPKGQDFFRARREETLSVFDLKKAIDDLDAGLAAEIANAVDEEIADAIKSIQTSLTGSTKAISDGIFSKVKRLSTKQDALKSEVTATTKKTLAESVAGLQKQVAQVQTAVTAAIKESSDNAKSATAKIQTTVSDLEKQGKGVEAALKKGLEQAASSDNIDKALQEDGIAKDINAVSGALKVYTDPKVPKFRVKSFHTYNQAHGWIFNNNAKFYGGVNPQRWTDSNAIASQMSGDKDILRTLFTDSQYCSATSGNCHVYSFGNYAYSSTDSNLFAVWMRIENTKDNDINWRSSFYITGCSDGCQGGQENKASIAVNGRSSWQSNHDQGAAGHHRDVNINIPKKRISNVIFIANGARDSGDLQTTALAFDQGCLNLPSGLNWLMDHDIVQGKDWST